MESDVKAIHNCFVLLLGLLESYLDALVDVVVEVGISHRDLRPVLA